MELMVKDIEKEYKQLMYSQRPEGRFLDYNRLQQHIDMFSRSNELQCVAVTIYDNCRNEHVYVSEYHKRLFGSGEVEVHPDDLDDVLKNAIASLKHVFQGNKNFAHMKTIREYRVRMGDKFRRVTESFRVLETDRIGNIWLTLCVLEISPNQLPPFYGQLPDCQYCYRRGVFSLNPVFSERIHLDETRAGDIGFDCSR